MYSLMFVAFLKNQYKEACEREALNMVSDEKVQTPDIEPRVQTPLIEPEIAAKKKAETLSGLMESIKRE